MTTQHSEGWAWCRTSAKCTAKEWIANVVGSCGGWRTPDESCMNMEVAEDKDMFFMNMVEGGQDQAR